MLTHPTGLFSGDYNSALRGCWPLKFLHTLQLPKMYFKSDLGRRAASCWALPHISSLEIMRHVLKTNFLSSMLPPYEQRPVQRRPSEYKRCINTAKRNPN